MKTPVIIPAFKEERVIGQTLASLPGSLVDPYVVVNGSTDRTAEIADSYGATVINLEAQGKLPAIQHTLRILGNRALEPLIILDADTRPLMPKRWHDAMLKHLIGTEPEIPAALGGPVWFKDGGLLNATAHSLLQLRRVKRDVKSRTAESGVVQAGPNMGLYIQNEALLEQILELPHEWPGEDKAIIEKVISNSGKYIQPLQPSIYALTRMREAFPTIAERLRISREETVRRINEHYIQRAAPGSRPHLQ